MTWSFPEKQLGTMHLERLTDDFGIWQHTDKNRIDRKMGYALDDAARGLVTALYVGRDDLASVYHDFVVRACASNPPTVFYSPDRKPLEHAPSADATAQVVWALGLEKKFEKEFAIPPGMYERLCGYLFSWDFIRGWAYAILGTRYGRTGLTKRFGTKLMEEISSNVTDEWFWPEETITYGNAIIPFALLAGGTRTHEESWVTTGLKLLDHLNRIQYVTGVPSIIGNRGWCERGKPMALYDQQPIEAAYMTIVNVEAYTITNENSYLVHAMNFFSWFWGNNLRGEPMVNVARESVYDGLEEHQISSNQGAENIVCYLLAQHYIWPYLTSSERR